MNLVWGHDQIILGDSSGKEILRKKHYGLPFMDWDDFVGARKLLAKTHIQDRHESQSETSVNTVIMDLAGDGVCLPAEWKQWTMA
eukprot:830193-Prorocentrum_lima.AAC.1